MKLKLNDTFCKELSADESRENSSRQVLNASFSYVNPVIPANPKLIHVSTDVLHDIGLQTADVHSKEFLDVFSGSKIYACTTPYAMCYGGHQFGNWAGQLGDGRAINLFEVNNNDKQFALQLKGAGQTPYSRHADGLAVLRSSIREHLMSEAMHHLGVPTTRSLSLMLSGNQVMRDVLYNGNSAYEKGAVICRVAPTFIRFGNFQIFAARNDRDNLTQLTNYTIQHFFKEINPKSGDAALQFFQAVAHKTFEMVLKWQSFGFVHGVMNTDNMSILGLTIDYGPFGWLENFDLNWTPNTTDFNSRRYVYGNQAGVALWNLWQLANALFPIIQDKEGIEAVLQQFQKNFVPSLHHSFLEKIGLTHEAANTNLIEQLFTLLEQSEIDFTLFFRNLAEYDSSKKDEFMGWLSLMSYTNDLTKHESLWLDWLAKYDIALGKTKLASRERKLRMNAVNPKYVLRNYMAQMAIEKADEGDYSLIEELYQLLKKPFDEQKNQEKWFAKRPDWAKEKVGSSMLSCSS